MVARELWQITTHDPRAEPEGEVWLSAIIPMATMNQLIYIPPLIGQWFLSMETSLSIETNSTLKVTRQRIIQLKKIN
jgi:hypothetical protein